MLVSVFPEATLATLISLRWLNKRPSAGEKRLSVPTGWELTGHITKFEAEVVAVSMQLAREVMTFNKSVYSF